MQEINSEPVTTVPPEDVKTKPPAEIMVPDGSAPKCSVELEPMEKWVGVEDPDKCRPCLLAPVVQWYADELRASGKASMADKLISDAEELEPLTLCKELDSIKNEVEEPLRERLKDFDCAVQTYKEQDS